MVLSFALLGLTVAAVWLPDVRIGERWRLAPWQPLFVLAVAIGMANGRIAAPAVVALAALWAAAHLSVHHADRRVRVVATVALVALVLALASHLVPGFANRLIVGREPVSAGAPPVTLRAAFDMVAAGLLLLAYRCPRVRRAADWPRVIAIGLATGIATAVVVIGVVAAAGLIAFDPKVPAISGPWLATNLLMAALLEESFFRGLIQGRLQDALQGAPRWRWLPIAIASLLFGLAHAGGGAALVVAATAAGVGYGLAFRAARSIEAPILAHLSLNAVHFFGFTYPFAPP
jgi:membrane protease YdiL (CAAX protease family)